MSSWSIKFNQVQGTTDVERDEAQARIVAAARKFDVGMEENDWRELKVGGRDK